MSKNRLTESKETSPENQAGTKAQPATRPTNQELRGHMDFNTEGGRVYKTQVRPIRTGRRSGGSGTKRKRVKKKKKAPDYT